MKKQKIAVLGGGVGAMTAAFYLTDRPGWQDRFEVTVYQLGWRLGGKGASGCNRDAHDRIEEHGFHIFFGYYENAFALMKRLYAELARDPGAPLATWDEAFRPWSYFVLYEEVAGRRVPWVFDFARNADSPGEGEALMSPWAMAQTILGWVRSAFEMTPVAPPADAFADIFAEAEAGGVGRLSPGTYLRLAHEGARRLSGGQALGELGPLGRLLREFIAWLHEQARAAALESRRLLTLAELGAAVVVGMIEDDLIAQPVDWFKIDALTFPDWLRKHGASEEAATSPPVELCTKMNFAQHRGGFGAGSCLVFALRMVLTYKGAFAWRMQAGMGDVIFAPFYEVLRRRGVKFEFFHSVDELGVGTDPATGRPVVDSIEVGVQMKVKGGGEYRPLYDVRGLPCWPSAPLYEQLERGEELRGSGESLENWWSRWPNAGARTLLRGRDFDVVVLGISVGAYPYVCRQLVDNPATPRFGDMVRGLAVTDTIGAQLWLTPSAADLGWSLGAGPLCGTYFDPCDTVADMSYLAGREGWPPSTVGSIQYLTAALPDAAPPETPPRTDHDYPFRRHDARRRAVLGWLDERASGLWPAASAGEGGGFDWQVLFDPQGRRGAARFDAQFCAGDLNPSDRYVLSVPGSVWSRLPAAGAGYANLVMAGDWVVTGLSQGCVESAVMAGMHASRALTGHPEAIVGDQQPDGDDVQRLPEGRPRGAYVEHDGNNTPMQPYIATGVTMYNFILRADYDKLEALVDRQLNLGGPTIYKPLGPFVSFVAAPIEQIAATEPRAWKGEKDFGFWVPVLAGREEGGAFFAERVAFFVPYLWVDDHLPQQAGREVFGYQKGVGRLSNPASPDDRAEFSIDALVVPEFGPPGAPSSAWQWRRLVTAARRDGGALGDLVGEFEAGAAFGAAVVGRLAVALSGRGTALPTLGLARALFENVVHRDVPMVYLKQFRDVADGRLACYQAIVEAPNRVTPGPFRAGFLPGRWALTVEQFASVRLVDKLGLVVVDGKVPSICDFWAQFGFTAEAGKVIWRGA